MSGDDKTNNAEWIAVDWGTSHLRVWRMSAQGDILDRRRSEKGMNKLVSTQFESTLISLIDDWLNNDSTCQVLACGMVGSRQGWQEAKYLSTPCSPCGSFTRVSVQDPRINVSILPGVKQLSPADVMRGEETQIAGLLVDNQEYNGVVCLPGTHSKWAKIVAGKITEFQTFLTGELFALLSKQSVLRHSLDDSAWDNQAFTSAIGESIDQPQSVMAKLFSLRAQSLVSELSATSAHARLSGLLIGLELVNCKHYFLDTDKKVTIIGESTLSQHYMHALKTLSIDVEQKCSETMTLQGLTLAYQQLSAK